MSESAKGKAGREFSVISASGETTDEGLHAAIVNSPPDPRMVELVRARLEARGVPAAIIDRNLPSKQ